MSPPACLSIDLDNKWAYLKVHDQPEWKAYPSYFDRVIPRIVEFLAKRGLAATCFLVGRDAEKAQNRDALGSLIQTGHEIANHSYSHEPWIGSDPAKLEVEVEKAEKAIESLGAPKPVGFRAPGFVCSEPLLRILASRGYRYDSTILPTFAGPIARLYCRLGRAKAQGPIRKELFGGSFKAGFWPQKPFRWQLGGAGDLLEIPVTTMPLAKIPIHFTYLTALAGHSPFLAKNYFRLALELCRIAQIPPLILLHPLDFMGSEEDPDLNFHPGMKIDADSKRRLIESLFDSIQNRFSPEPLRDFAARLDDGPRVKTRRTAMIDCR